MKHLAIGNKIWIPYTLLVILLAVNFEARANPKEEAPPTQELISKIIKQGQINYKLSQNYGSFKRVVVKKFSKDGNVKKKGRDENLPYDLD